MDKYIRLLLLVLTLGFTLGAPALSFADKCDVSCEKGANSIECPGGCGCYCQDGKALCSCSSDTEKSCDVSCAKGDKSITCQGGGCGCFCDADKSPVCECYKGHKK